MFPTRPVVPGAGVSARQMGLLIGAELNVVRAAPSMVLWVVGGRGRLPVGMEGPQQTGASNEPVSKALGAPATHMQLLSPGMELVRYVMLGLQTTVNTCFTADD